MNSSNVKKQLNPSYQRHNNASLYINNSVSIDFVIKGNNNYYVQDTLIFNNTWIAGTLSSPYLGHEYSASD